jgi:hypothetical protein
MALIGYLFQRADHYCAALWENGSYSVASSIAGLDITLSLSLGSPKEVNV